MHITASRSQQEILAWAQRIRDLLKQRGDQTAIEGIDAATARYDSDRFLIAVLGKAKRGKSTLLNAILGRHDDLLAPIDKLPASSAITRFVFSEKEAAIVFFRDGRQEQIGYDRIREYVTEDLNPENKKGVDVVEVTGPFSGMDKDLTLMDTPGAGSINEYHDAILHAIIPQADAVVFLVTARMPLDQDELELLQNVKKADIGKVFFAVNRVDESNEQDIVAAIAHNRKLLAEIGINVERIHRISAKNAFLGKVAGSGLPELLGEINGFLTSKKRGVLNARLVSQVRQCAEAAAQALAVEVASFGRNPEQLDEDLRKLRDSKCSLEQERGLAEREFELDWNRAIDRFEQEVKDAKSGARASVLNRISRAPLMGVRALAKELPTIITRTIEDQLASPAQHWEESARAASRKLQESYPAIEVKSAGEVSIRMREGHAVIVAGLGGAAAVATGVGLAAVGSAAAASIAAANAAALAAATTTVAAPSAIAGIGSLLSSWGLGGLGTALTTLGTGTATVATPVALTTTPLWVALAGPIGWTLAGLGALAVPFAWRASKLRQKEQIAEACSDQIDQVFQRLQTERIPALRRMGESVLEDFRLRLERQLRQIEAAMRDVRDNRPDPQKVQTIQQLSRALQGALADAPQTWLQSAE